MIGYNSDLEFQKQKLYSIIKENAVIFEIIQKAQTLEIPNYNQFLVYAPYGLNDMFGQIIRANKTQITKETYIQKCNKWLKKWNTLNIVEW